MVDVSVSSLGFGSLDLGIVAIRFQLTQGRQVSDLLVGSLGEEEVQRRREPSNISGMGDFPLHGFKVLDPPFYQYWESSDLLVTSPPATVLVSEVTIL